MHVTVHIDIFMHQALMDLTQTLSILSCSYSIERITNDHLLLSLLTSSRQVLGFDIHKTTCAIMKVTANSICMLNIIRASP